VSIDQIQTQRRRGTETRSEMQTLCIPLRVSVSPCFLSRCFPLADRLLRNDSSAGASGRSRNNLRHRLRATLERGSAGFTWPIYRMGFWRLELVRAGAHRMVRRDYPDFHPAASTLAQRTIVAQPGDDAIRHELGASTLLRFDVSTACAQQLNDVLESDTNGTSARRFTAPTA
jgi:hypothetical protein